MLQGRRSDLVTCAQKIISYIGEFKYKEQFYKNLLRHFKISPTAPTSQCIVHLEGLHVDYERRYNDLIKMDYPLWFVDLESYER